MDYSDYKLDNRRSWHGDDEFDKMSINFRTYKIRFFGLTMIALSSMASALNWLSISIVPDHATEYFSSADFKIVNWFSSIFMFAYLVFGPISSWVYENYSIKTGIIICGILQSTGAWIRYFCAFAPSNRGKLILAIFGQTICAAGQPFILNVSTPYAAMWFSADGRASATMVGGLANCAGMAFASLIIPAIVVDANSIEKNFLVIACITTLIAIPTVFIPRRPKTPPSFSASSKNKFALSFGQSFYELFTNWNYMIILVCFSIACALASAFSTFLPQMVAPYEVDNGKAGYLSAGFIISGLAGSTCCAFLIDRTKQHKLALKCFIPSLGLFYLSFYLSLKHGNFETTLFVCIFFGFLTFSLLPVLLELSVECTFPISESISSSTLWMVSQFACILVFLFMDLLRNPDKTYTRSLVFCMGITFPLIIPCLFYNSPNKRMEFEEKNRLVAG